ncbi:Proline dehydrogenase [Mycena kentingensis (nom. inval.)]|nr:Proline dehydrogenase [Mycena kentingensis (nom. inval.)]
MLRLLPPRPLLRIGLRHASSTPSRTIFRRSFVVVGGVALAASVGLGSKVYMDAATVALPLPTPSASKDSDDKTPFKSLLRTYVVYSMCSFPWLVDNAPRLLETFSSIPGLKWLTESFFVGGDSAAETLPVLRTLRENNTGTLFAYSIEVDEAEAMASASSGSTQNSPHKAIVKEMLNCIDVAADFEANLGARKAGKRTWVAVKMTALLPDASALIRLSSHIIATRAPTALPLVVFPGNPVASDLAVLSSKGNALLTSSDIAMLRELHKDLEAICARASSRGVRIIIDAEYSWYEPAIDALALALMRQFNAGTDGPLVYATYQAYLRRTQAHLLHALKDAQKHKYALGAKLVRGAYHPHEIAAHGAAGLSISPDALPPVWGVKADTDASYNACAGMLLDAVAEDVKRKSGAPQSVGVLFGTHNWESCRTIIKGLHERGLGVTTPEGRLRIEERVAERITFGQLYGMCDDLTQYLAQRMESSAPMVIKYVPYGALAEVMPYLSRRAIENKSILGSGTAKHERERAWALMKFW